jgi:Flp pilus assembly pilin Flp
MFGRSLADEHAERGATSVEYGLMVAFIAITIFGAVATFGGAVKYLFEQIPPSMWP